MQSISRSVNDKGTHREVNVYSSQTKKQSYSSFMKDGPWMYRLVWMGTETQVKIPIS